jgi:putative transport protein
MSLFGGIISISGITFLMFSIFAIIVIGFALGRITIKGVSLGDAGVFIVALIYGCLFYDQIKSALPGYDTNALKIVDKMHSPICLYHIKALVNKPAPTVSRVGGH